MKTVLFSTLPSKTTDTMQLSWISWCPCSQPLSSAWTYLELNATISMESTFQLV